MLAQRRTAATELEHVAPVSRAPESKERVVVARLLKQSFRDTRAWNDFAAACDYSSFIGSLHYARLSAATGKLITVEIFVQDKMCERKVGQAAIIRSRAGERHIVDGLKLLPDWGDLWPSAMRALLRLLGAGRWRYGSHWSGEPPRASDVAAFPGVKIQVVRRLYVYTIDFSRWREWNDYLQELNSNVRRSVRRAEKLPDLEVRLETGWRSVRSFGLLDAMRRTTLTRKGVATHPGLRPLPGSFFRFLLRVATIGNGVVLAVARSNGEPHAMLSGIEFGPSMFYLEGASAGSNNGVSWYLLVSMIERCYRRNPVGRFVMGHEDDVNRTSVGWENLVRSRLQCQADRLPSDEITFDYC